MMDERTKNVMYESMRRGLRAGVHGGGDVTLQRMRTARATTNRRLFMEHKKLNKQCAATIRHHRSDARIAQVGTFTLTVTILIYTIS